jgi:hypothetical protein
MHDFLLIVACMYIIDVRNSLGLQYKKKNARDKSMNQLRFPTGQKSVFIGRIE